MDLLVAKRLFYAFFFFSSWLSNCGTMNYCGTNYYVRLIYTDATA